MKTRSPGLSVSVIMPCLNEEDFIEKAILSLVDDSILDDFEVLVVDGMSSDRTPRIVKQLARKGLPVKLIENVKKNQADGMNLGILVARGEIILRADSHCLYPRGYIKSCVDLKAQTEADNVGGVMRPEGQSPVQKAIAEAMRHPIGVGNARFHLGNFTGYVDTVYLGTFSKELFSKLGFFDPECVPNEDAELNLRILKGGGKIYLDSGLAVTYFPRATFLGLAGQYFRYGQGRLRTSLKHRSLTSWRQLFPVLLVLSLLVSLSLAGLEPRVLLFPLLYVISMFLFAFLSRTHFRKGFRHRVRLAGAFVIMHIFWGTGFLLALIKKAGARHAPKSR